MAEEKATTAYSPTQLTPTLTFAEAWPLWYRSKEQEIAEKTQACYREYKRVLLPFLGALRLDEITLQDIVRYRDERRKTAGPSLINHEIHAVGQILKQVDLWQPIRKRYEQMKIPRGKGPGRRLTTEELVHLFECAQLKSKWNLAYLAALVSVETGCGPGEVLSLRLRDIDQGAQTLHIQGTKTDERVRDIPMTHDCAVALNELEAIARTKGACLPDHYLFPHRAHVKGAKPDPTRHMGSYKQAWGKLRQEAAKKFPRLIDVRRYDLRHTAVSVMCENPNMDEQTLKQVVGHGPYSRVMVETYFHARQKRKREAVAVLDGITRRRTVTAIPENKPPQRGSRPLSGGNVRTSRPLPSAVDEEESLFSSFE